MDFLEQRGLPLTEENLAIWQKDLEAREQAAKDRNQDLKHTRTEILKEYNLLKRKEAQLFKRRAASSRRSWSRPRVGRRYLYEVIIAINVAMFLLSLIFPKLTFYLALYGPMVFIKGEYYRFFTTMFMHGSILHIFFNMYALFILGDQLENLLGKTSFAILYFGSGIVGAAVTYFVNPLILSVGASGAIFGLLGFVLYARVFRYSGITPAIQSSLLTVLGINLIIAILPGSNIDVWSHIGGLLGGFLIGMIMGPSGGYLRSEKDKISQVSLGVLGIVVVFLAVFFRFRSF
ncbi:MAG: rhomboid family intramembrane serine protease [Firmicutes bacterium]|nr:rhomboid family intramembrane serine protease [Bacillota bacterium]MDD4693250.1 rhomboid family intramembrane serine protease [Bacillota bacterium]